MAKLDELLLQISKTDPELFKVYEHKLNRDSPTFFDDLDVFYTRLGISLNEYAEIIREEYRRLSKKHNGMDLS